MLAPVITLYQPPPAWGISSLSPFGVKVETYLRMVGLPYQTRGADPRKNPKGKVPWIEEDGRMVTDSSDIIDHLKARHGDPLDAGLSPEQRALAHLARRLVEEHLYWVVAYGRWAEPEGYAHARSSFAPLFPPLLRGVIIRHIRKSMLAQLHSQGLGRHDRADIYRRGGEDLAALSTLLGARPYFLGEQPSSVDASIYALTASIWLHPADTPLRRDLARSPNLVAYTERMHGRYFGAPAPAGEADRGA